MFELGPFWFGIVIGFVTYRTLKHKMDSGISDIASVVAAIGGGAVVTLFKPDSSRFDVYAFGLAIGFFLYLALSLVITHFNGSKAAVEFLGDDTAGR